MPKTRAADGAEEKLAEHFRGRPEKQGWSVAEDRALREAIKAFAAANDASVYQTGKVTLANRLAISLEPALLSGNTIRLSAASVTPGSRPSSTGLPSNRRRSRPRCRAVAVTEEARDLHRGLVQVLYCFTLALRASAQVFPKAVERARMGRRGTPMFPSKTAENSR